MPQPVADTRSTGRRSARTRSQLLKRRRTSLGVSTLVGILSDPRSQRAVRAWLAASTKCRFGARARYIAGRRPQRTASRSWPKEEPDPSGHRRLRAGGNVLPPSRRAHQLRRLCSVHTNQRSLSVKRRLLHALLCRERRRPMAHPATSPAPRATRHLLGAGSKDVCHARPLPARHAPGSGSRIVWS
jgi:hypothetical protein